MVAARFLPPKIDIAVTSNSWDNLVTDSAKPAITSGPFAAVELNARVPPSTC